MKAPVRILFAAFLMLAFSACKTDKDQPASEETETAAPSEQQSVNTGTGIY